MDLKKPLPQPIKLPIDFFSYHVIRLSPTKQLIFCVVGALKNQPAAVVAEIREIGQGAHRFGKKVSFEVLTFKKDPMVYADGKSKMYMPEKFHFKIYDTTEGDIYLGAQISSNWSYAAMGYIAAYDWSSNLKEFPTGKGYLAYSDRRDL